MKTKTSGEIISEYHSTWQAFASAFESEGIASIKYHHMLNGIIPETSEFLAYWNAQQLFLALCED